ncbi:hypothetical protein SXCC_04142 [Gluconacetobacter sp. SXCC-1]|nr:hypothetical protein SXCC_04142 [Gluconacetobacter sp. SXCC-1]
MAGTIRTAAPQHHDHDEERLGAVSVAGPVERREGCELGYSRYTCSSGVFPRHWLS